MVGLCKGYSRNKIGQILVLFRKNLMKAWKTEAFEQNYFREKRLQCISQNSLKRTFDEVLSYLSHSLGPYWKKLHHKCFSTTYKVFQNSYSLERWWTAVSEKIAYKTKTEWKGSTDHKSTITFQIKKNWRRRLNFFTFVSILKPVFTEVIKKL